MSRSLKGGYFRSKDFGVLHEDINKAVASVMSKSGEVSSLVYAEHLSNLIEGLDDKEFINFFPLVPTEDEGRLNDSRIRENFIVRVFSFKRFILLLKEKFSLGKWVKFHTQHKFLLLAHSRKHYDELGELVAHAKTIKPSALKEKYGDLFMEALACKTTPKKNTDVLLHMMGFFKKLLNKVEKEDILAAIEDYRNEILPLIVPVTIIRHQVKKYNIEYLRDQVYLNPHPKELMLLNHV